MASTLNLATNAETTGLSDEAGTKIYFSFWRWRLSGGWMGGANYANQGWQWKPCVNNMSHQFEDKRNCKSLQRKSLQRNKCKDHKPSFSACCTSLVELASSHSSCSLSVWSIIITQLFSIVILWSWIACWRLSWRFPLVLKPSFLQSLSLIHYNAPRAHYRLFNFREIDLCVVIFLHKSCSPILSHYQSISKYSKRKDDACT